MVNKNIFILFTWVWWFSPLNNKQKKKSNRITFYSELFKAPKKRIIQEIEDLSILFCHKEVNTGIFICFLK